MELEYIDNNRQYENYKKDIVTKIAYLIGVKDSIIKTNRFEQNIISSLEENDNAKIIRALSILRSEFIRNFKEISSRNMNLEPLETLTDLISVDLIKYLRNKGIEIVTLNPKELVDIIFQECHIQGSPYQLEAEKKVFYDKYIKKGFKVSIVGEGDEQRFMMELASVK